MSVGSGAGFGADLVGSDWFWGRLFMRWVGSVNGDVLSSLEQSAELDSSFDNPFPSCIRDIIGHPFDRSFKKSRNSSGLTSS